MKPSLLAALVTALAFVAVLPGTASAATCSDYPNQAAAQRAHDTRDPPHGGTYCDSLPCPCSYDTVPRPPTQTCTRPPGIANISFSATKCPNIRRHFLGALRR